MRPREKTRRSTQRCQRSEARWPLWAEFEHGTRQLDHVSASALGVAGWEAPAIRNSGRPAGRRETAPPGGRETQGPRLRLKRGDGFSKARRHQAPGAAQQVARHQIRWEPSEGASWRAQQTRRLGSLAEAHAEALPVGTNRTRWRRGESHQRSEACQPTSLDNAPTD